MGKNLNTPSYWERRFSSGDWEINRGRQQTESFARGQMPHIAIRKEFAGTLLDFGCGLGDAMPIYRESFPKARLVGIDISLSAINLCRKHYGSIASFIQGSIEDVPNVDVIIASNVIEHLENDRTVVKQLLSKCKCLFVVVPYKEHPLHVEHVNCYDEHYFSEIGKYDFRVFQCAGWSYFGVRNLYYEVYLKNTLRLLLGRPLIRQRSQIIFRFGELSAAAAEGMTQH